MALRAAGALQPPYQPPPPHPPTAAGGPHPPTVDVSQAWEVDSAHRFVRRQGDGHLLHVGLDHGLTLCDTADPHPPPLRPWRPCHLVMWSPPRRRSAGGSASADADADEGPDRGADRPYFLSELADLTIAPDIYTYHRDEHNLMQYQVCLGTEKLLAAELHRRGDLTLAATRPAAIPRWFAPGYTHREARERAVIADAQRLRTARPGDIHHPAWIRRTSPQESHSLADSPDPLATDVQTPHHSPTLTPTPPSPAGSTHRLPCFLAITGPAPTDPDTAPPQHSGHAMITRHRAQASVTAHPPRQRPPAHPPAPPPHVTVAEARKHRACWEQLCHTNIRKADISVAFRALHCQLRTPSFLTYCLYKSGPVDRTGDTPMERACCRWPACRTPLPTNPVVLQPTTIANTSHVLLHCPLTRRAAQWLCDTWAAIDDGNSPPAVPDVIIAGDPTAWRPRRANTDLWTRLRAIYLTKAWAAHCIVHHGGPTPSPTSIAATTLRAAILAMRTEFTAAYTAPSELAQECDAHMTGAQQRQSRDDEGDDPVAAFKRIWVGSGLCDVVDKRLVVRWTATHPVPLPAAQPESRPPPPQPTPTAPLLPPPPHPVPPPPAQPRPPGAQAAAPLPRLHLV